MPTDNRKGVAGAAALVSAMSRSGVKLPFYELYIINGGSLKGCMGHADADAQRGTHDDLLREALNSIEEYKFYSSQIEHVADAMFPERPKLCRWTTA